MKENNIITVENLSYKKIFNNLNMNIIKNQFVAISGSNNCGKTTLIKILSGLISTENMITMNGAYLESINKTKLFYDEGIVLLNEEINFLFDTVKEEILFVLENINIDENKKIKRYNDVVKLLNLKPYEKINPNNLSRNVKIRVLLALAIIHKPKILYIDDICIMMMKKETKQILDILTYLNKKEKMTIVMSTNRLEETVNCDYLYILNNGQVALEGHPLDILKDDNIINRLGLSIPFMIDLSVKLKDYDLLDDIILNMDGLVNTLWK